MASYGYTFNSGDGVTPTRLNAARTVSDIVNADIKSDAAIAGSKLEDGAITNAKVNASAAIAYSKLNLTNSIVAGDVTAGAITASKVADGAVVQVVNSSTSSISTYTSTIPYDNTAPQNTEGSEVLSLSITPQSATNKVLVSANIFFTPNSNASYSVALFRGSTCIFANAIAQTGQNYPAPLMLQFVDSPATTSSTTYSVRIGGTAGNTFYINGNSAEQKFGATPKSSITIMEIKAS